MGVTGMMDDPLQYICLLFFQLQYIHIQQQSTEVWMIIGIKIIGENFEVEVENCSFLCKAMILDERTIV